MNIFKRISKRLSTGVKASVVYTVSSLFSKGLAIITLPIFTRLMSADEIGVVTLYNSWHALLAIVATLSLTSGGFSLAMKEFHKERDQYCASVLTLTSCVAVILGFVYFLAPGFWCDLTGLQPPLMILMLAQFLLWPAYDFWLMRQRYEYKYKAAGIVSFLSTLAAAIVSVWAVVYASRAGVQELGTVRLYANYAVLLCLAAVLWGWTLYKGRTLYSRTYWTFSLSLSIPLIGNALATQILSVSDRIMIDKMVGSSAVGIYGTLYTVSSLSLLVWHSINASFVPYLFDNLDNPKKKDDINTVSAQLFALFAGIAFLMTIVAPEIVKVLATEEYYEAIYIMPPIAAGVFLTAVTNMYSNVLIYHKKTKYIMISTIVAAGVNLGLNYVFIPIAGYMAAAYTTLAAYIIHAGIQGIVAYCVHKKLTGEGIYHTKTIIGLSIGTIAACLLCLLLYNLTLLRWAVILAVLLLVMCLRRPIIRVLTYRKRG